MILKGGAYCPTEIKLAFLFPTQFMEPKGLPEAFDGEDFIDGDDVMLVLGDNIFFGPGFSNLLHKSIEQNVGGTIFICCS